MYTCIYIYIYIYSNTDNMHIIINNYKHKGGKVLLNEILLLRIARQGTACLIAIIS